MKKLNIKNKKTLRTETTNSTIFCSSSSRIHREKCCVRLFQAAEIFAKCWSPCWNLPPYSSAWSV